MRADDLEVIGPDGDDLLTFEERAHQAAAGVRRAVDVEPPPLRSTTTATRAVQFGVAVVVLVAVVVGAVAVARRSSGPVHVTPPPPAFTDADRQAAVAQMVRRLAGADYAGAEVAFDASLRQDMDPLLLRARWQTVLNAYGPFRHQDTAPSSGMTASVWYVPVTFARGKLWIEATFDLAGQISTFGYVVALTASPPPTAVVESRAADLVRRLASGDLAAVTATLDPLGLASATPADFALEWTQFERAYGAFSAQGQPTEPYEGAGVVNVPIVWAHGRGYVQVFFDNNGQVRGFELLRPDAPISALTGTVVVEPSPIAQARATAVGTDAAAGRFASVAAALSPLGAANLTPSQLHQSWLSVTGRLGRLRSTQQPAVAGRSAEAVLYEIALTFDHGQAHVQVVIDDQQRVEYVVIKPGPPTRNFGQ
jgi:hypothetical protein